MFHGMHIEASITVALYLDMAVVLFALLLRQPSENQHEQPGVSNYHHKTGE